MTRRSVVAVAVFAGWTLFVWAGRVRNAFGDDSLSGTEVRNAALFASVFVVLALVVAATLLTARRSGVTSALRGSVAALGVWTIGVWIVKVIDIAFGGDYSIGFVVVHAVLATVSIALAAVAVRAVWSPGERPSDLAAAGEVLASDRNGRGGEQPPSVRTDSR